MARRSQARRRHIATLAAGAALALGLAGCTNNDAKRSDVVDAMTDSGLDDEQATCIGDAFEEEFDQDTLNDLASADAPEDFPSGTSDRVNEILADCTGSESGGGEPSDETDDTGDTGDESDTTDTTGEPTSETTEADSGG
jgi:hypothetical protein